MLNDIENLKKKADKIKQAELEADKIKQAELEADKIKQAELEADKKKLIGDIERLAIIGYNTLIHDSKVDSERRAQIKRGLEVLKMVKDILRD